MWRSSHSDHTPRATGEFRSVMANVSACTDHFCLFNVSRGGDPCEHHDLSAHFPDVVARLTKRLDAYRKSVQENCCGRRPPPGMPSFAGCGCAPVQANVSSAGQQKPTPAWRPCDGV